jgi:hypothetical protein
MRKSFAGAIALVLSVALAGCAPGSFGAKVEGDRNSRIWRGARLDTCHILDIKKSARFQAGLGRQ